MPGQGASDGVLRSIARLARDPACVRHVDEGTLLFLSNCVLCHGLPGVDKGGNIRNLGYVSKETITNLKDFVFKGPFRDQGMTMRPISRT